MENINEFENNELVDEALDEQFETKEIPFEEYEPQQEAKVEKKSEEKTLGLVSLIFGILAIISNFVSLPLCAYFPFIGIGFAIADKLKNKKLTHAGFCGLICSIVAYALTVIFAFLTIVLLVAVYFLIFAIGIITSGAATY